MKPTPFELMKLRGVANYQFGSRAGIDLFSRNVSVTHSPRTGRLRLIFRDGKLLATLRPRDGLLALSLHGARLLAAKSKPPRWRVIVRKDVASFIKQGKSVFAKHVVSADPRIRPGDEAIVVDDDDELLAVGRALLSGEEMLSFRNGVAVKVRSGVKTAEDEPA